MLKKYRLLIFVYVIVLELNIEASSSQFFVLLPPLFELILEIERDGHHGGRLLNLLHKRCHCGVPELQTCVQRYAFAIYLLEMGISRTSLIFDKLVNCFLHLYTSYVYNLYVCWNKHLLTQMPNSSFIACNLLFLFCWKSF